MRPLSRVEWAISLTLVTLTYITGATACMPDGATNSGLTQGKPTYVCLVFSHPTWGTGDSNFSRVAFTPSADKFTRLQFADSKILPSIFIDPGYQPYFSFGSGCFEYFMYDSIRLPWCPEGLDLCPPCSNLV